MSTIKVDTIKTTSNVEVFTCKAWVNFDGTTNTGGSCTIRASGNVTSVTDNGTGDYTVNFTTAMTDVNYNAIVTSGLKGNTWGIHMQSLTAPTASAFRFLTVNTVDTPLDNSYVYASFFR